MDVARVKIEPIHGEELTQSVISQERGESEREGGGREREREKELTTYSSEKPWSVSGSPVVGSQSFTVNLSVFRNVPLTTYTEHKLKISNCK